MLLNLPQGIFNTVSYFPFTFPLLSVRSDTGSASDWTVDIGGGMTAFNGTGPEWVLENTSTDRAYVYQTFSIGAEREAVVDAGNTLIDVSHTFRTLAGDNDGTAAFVEFWDGSSNFLGRTFTTDQFNDTTDITVSQNNKRVPPGTRTVRVGWLASNSAGNQHSSYVKDLACTIKEETADTWDDVVLVFAERNANLTGWTSTVGAMTVLAYPTGLADREWAITDVYGGGNVANTTAHKNYAFPTGWDTKVSAGNVYFLFRGSMHNANQSDDVEITVRLNNGSTNPTVTTGLVEVVTDLHYVELTGAVPSDTTSIDIELRFRRQDGTSNDGSVEMMSLMLYEQA